MPLTVDSNARSASVPGYTFALDFSNDGALLACATVTDDDLAPAVRVLRTSDGRLVASYMQLGVEAGRGVAFVGDGREIVFLFRRRDDSETRLLRVALDSRAPVELARYSMSVRNHAIVRDCAASRFAVLGNQIEVWDAPRNQRLYALPGANRHGDVHAAFSRDGSRLYAYGTVADAIVRYDVATGNETARWPAPAEQGAQLLVTQDERYLVAARVHHRGAYIYDLTSGQMLSPRADSTIKLDAESQWRPWVASQDSQQLICLKASLWCLRLPGLEDVSAHDLITPPRVKAWAAASAWDAPMIAFGSVEDATVRWFALT